MMKKVLVLIAMVGLGYLIAWAFSEDQSQQKARTESLKAEVQQLTTAIGKTEIERDTLKVRMALTEKNSDELQEQVDVLTASRNRLQEQAKEFSFSRDQSRQQLGEIIVSRDNLKKQIAELGVSRNNLQQQLDELTVSRNQLRRKVGELTMSTNAAITDVQTAQKRIEQLVAMLEDKTQKPGKPQDELIVTNQQAEDIQPPMIEIDRRPVLHSFNSNRQRVMPGQASTLSWQVSNAQRIRIEPEVGIVTALGSKAVKPSSATTYTLIAANQDGESRQTCRIEVGEASILQSKAVEKPAVIDEVVEPVAVSSQAVESPVVTSETAEPPDVTAETVEPVVVSSEAGERPTCHSFNTNRPMIMPGQTSILSWQVSNAERIRIEPEVGIVTALGSKAVKPSSATTYTLIAVNKDGESRKTCRIEVGQAATIQSKAIEKPAVIDEVVEPAATSSQAVESPVVTSETAEPPDVTAETVEPVVESIEAGGRPACHSFNTNRPLIMPGQASTLSWQVSNAERIRIEPDVGSVTALGSRTVKPSSTTTYTLIAVNKDGESRQTCKVEVGKDPAVQSQDIEKPAEVAEVAEPPAVSSEAVEPPALHSFNTTRPVIMQGQSSTLSWQVSNAEKIRIEPEIGPVSALGSRTVKPTATTTYTLTATNRAGDNKLSQKVEVSEHIKIFSSDSIDSQELLDEYKASDDSKVLPEQKLPASDPDVKQGKFLGYRARKDVTGKFVFIPVYENEQEE